jgi:guanyl-specific ribonuclease Sa
MRKNQKMTDHRTNEITTAARALYENIKADIENASTRIEHIRLTSLAQEAQNLVTLIESNGPDLEGATNE